MSESNKLYTLDTSLHDFDPEMFGSIEDLRNLHPTSDGWSAAMVCCSELGYQPDQNSLFEIGELFVVQNFGNVILPFGESTERTEISDAVENKRLKDIIVLGHIGCRTIEHFLLENRDNEWLEHGNSLRMFMKTHYPNLSKVDRLNVAAQENVLLQIEKELRSLESSGIQARLHGWIAVSESNQVLRYCPKSGQFVNKVA